MRKRKAAQQHHQELRLRGHHGPVVGGNLRPSEKHHVVQVVYVESHTEQRKRDEQNDAVPLVDGVLAPRGRSRQEHVRVDKQSRHFVD